MPDKKRKLLTIENPLRVVHAVVLTIMFSIFAIGYPLAAFGVAQKYVELLTWKRTVALMQITQLRR